MPANEWYKQWFSSPYYHKLYFEQNEQKARNFITRLANKLQPAAQSRMLEIACGQGQYSRILASLDFDVTGIDLSTDSINYANQFASDNLHFYQHDMRLPFWINYFDYAFNLFTSFGYFATKREHDDAIRTIATSLKPSGILVFDYLNVHYVEEHLVHNQEKRIDDTRFEIHRWQDDEHFYKKIIISDIALKQPVEITEKLKKFSLGDFTEMLSFQKMQVETVFGDYELQPYDIRKTPRMILFAKKA